jgi:hypothetical protein
MRVLSIWRVVLLRLGSKYPFLKIRFQPGGAARRLERCLSSIAPKSTAPLIKLYNSLFLFR